MKIKQQHDLRKANEKLEDKEADKRKAEGKLEEKKADIKKDELKDAEKKQKALDKKNEEDKPH